APGRKPKSGIKEESVIIDDDDPEVPPPKVTVMKLVTMQGHRFRKTDSVAADRARISRRDRFIEPLPVLQARIHISLWRHGVRTNAGASHVWLHPRVAHGRMRPCRGCCVYFCCGTRLRLCIDIRSALNFLALRRQGQSETSDAYGINNCFHRFPSILRYKG